MNGHSFTQPHSHSDDSPLTPEDRSGSGHATSSTRSRLGIELGQLLHVAGSGDVEAIRGILQDGKVQVNDADYDGRTALHLACSEGKVDAVKALLELGADVNPRDRYGNTPLADAQSYGNAEICNLLKDRGGHVSEANSLVRGKQRPQIKGQDDFEIDPADLDMEAAVKIGRGIFGDVRKARWKGTPVAVKVFQDNIGENKKAEEEFREELRILEQLRHPNVVQFLGAVTRSQPHMLVTEYLSKGNLYQILKRKGTLNAAEALGYALDVARGMNYLHQRKPESIVHRDLSPHNLLRDEAGHLKVADFGLSRIRVESRSMYLRDESGHGASGALLHLSGTTNSYRYLAPEVFTESSTRVFPPSVDVFSFGIIVYEMFEGMQKPKYSPDEAALKYADDTSRPPFRSHKYPPGMKELIAECWSQDARQRPSFDVILPRLEVMNKEYRLPSTMNLTVKKKCCVIL